MNDPLENFYTHNEKTVKKYSIYRAIQSARKRLNGIPVCTDVVAGRADSDKITLMELNQLADQMVSDTLSRVL